MTTDSDKTTLWRAIEQRKLTHSAAHYLTAILQLRQRQGYARVTDVADHLTVSRGAASRAAALLKERGWIREDPHRMLELTDEGLQQARNVEHNHRIMECFLNEILGLPEELAHEDACKLEHLLSRRTNAALGRLIRVLETDDLMLRKLHGRIEALRRAEPVTDPDLSDPATSEPDADSLSSIDKDGGRP